MPRKKKPKQNRPAEAIEESPSTTTTANPQEEESWTQTVRPKGPRPRDGEAASSYTGKDVRLTSDGRTWQVEMRRELNADEFDRLQRAGFDPVDDACLTWQASAQAVRDSGTDLNVLAVTLDRKGERLGRGR